MAIKYSVVPNHLITNRTVYRAQVAQTGSVNLARLADRIVAQGTTVRLPDVLAVLENTIMAAEAYLIEGFRVNLGGLCQLYPRVQGTFETLDDTFDPARHRLVLGARPGERLRRAFETGGTVERIEATEPAPVLLSFQDGSTGQANATVTPGGIGIIRGYRLKFPAIPVAGVFFVKQSDSAKLRVPTVTKNMPGELIFQIPNLAPATSYWLEVRARFGVQFRTGRLNATLTTPAA